MAKAAASLSWRSIRWTAGVGDLVLTASGSSARQTTITKDRPVDAVIMAVIDSLEVEGKVTFRKS